MIRAGIDPWVTIPEGTRVDFRHNPLPAGFFCTASPAFTGRIWLRGVPLASDNPQLAKVDTIVERLDDAVFNSRGVARTRFQVRALQLEGIKTFKNSCGEYRVQVTLDGEQPITRMRIVRENKDGGRFLVTVKINTKVVFTRVDNPSEKLEFSYPCHVRAQPVPSLGFRTGSRHSKAGRRSHDRHRLGRSRRTPSSAARRTSPLARVEARSSSGKRSITRPNTQFRRYSFFSLGARQGARAPCRSRSGALAGNADEAGEDPVVVAVGAGPGGRSLAVRRDGEGGPHTESPSG